LPFAIVAVEIVVTYARIPPHELYHVSGTGIDAGLGRAVVFLNFPVGLAALPLIVLAAERLRSTWWTAVAVLAAALCAVVFWPGVVDQADLDVKAINALPAAGVALALLLIVVAGFLRAPARVDLPIAVLIAALTFIALPWIAADLGFFLDHVPVLGSIFLTGKIVDGHPAVHHGHHHGMDGTLLVVAGIATIAVLRHARSPALRATVATYLGLQIAYGLANIANDAWLEQVVKRGWTSFEIPNVLRPGFTLGWLGIVIAAAIFSVFVRRRAQRWAS
jgi:hypothetical protein